MNAKLQKLRYLISKCSNIKSSQLIKYSQSRKTEYVIARQVHMVCLYVSFDISLAYAGEKYYNKNHSTVFHSIKAVNDLLDTCHFFRKNYEPVFRYAYELNPIKTKQYLHLNWMLKEQK